MGHNNSTIKKKAINDNTYVEGIAYELSKDKSETVGQRMTGNANYTVNPVQKNSTVTNVIPLNKRNVQSRFSNRFEYPQYSQDISNDYCQFSNTITNEFSTNKAHFVVKEVEENKLQKGDYMENEKILEMYISKVSNDQSELRADIRASEERTANSIATIDKRIDRMTDDFEKRMNRLEDLIVRQSEMFKDQIDKQSVQISEQNKKFEDAVKEIKSDSKATRNFNLGIFLSTVAIVIALIIGMAQMVTSIKLATPISTNIDDDTQQTTANLPAEIKE